MMFQKWDNNDNLAGIFGGVLIFQLQQDGLHAGHVLGAVLVGILAAEIAQLSHTFPFSAGRDIIHFSHKFLFALPVILLGLAQVVFVPLVPEIQC